LPRDRFSGFSGSVRRFLNAVSTEEVVKKEHQRIEEDEEEKNNETSTSRSQLNETNEFDTQMSLFIGKIIMQLYTNYSVDSERKINGFRGRTLILLK